MMMRGAKVWGGVVLGGARGRRDNNTGWFYIYCTEQILCGDGQCGVGASWRKAWVFTRRMSLGIVECV
jgi:hypothetical protein